MPAGAGPSLSHCSGPSLPGRLLVAAGERPGWGRGREGTWPVTYHLAHPSAPLTLGAGRRGSVSLLCGICSAPSPWATAAAGGPTGPQSAVRWLPSPLRAALGGVDVFSLSLPSSTLGGVRAPQILTPPQAAWGGEPALPQPPAWSWGLAVVIPGRLPLAGTRSVSRLPDHGPAWLT